MTAPDLTTHLAEVLKEHTWQSVDIQGRVECSCGQAGITGDHEDHQAEQLAAMVMASQAEAWDESLVAAFNDFRITESNMEEMQQANPYRSNDE